ncbi:hypothetical protein EHQ43_10105 [Leptospira bouyouniensis]|uniref:Uncharacterized protein n=1 Tax=Leptospira bouyouniensis TaxID=2484911 RepID=A0A7I0HRI5_9LEPT|nr:hypothetical protein [Leptospira bouyouniensis]TGL04988.1 hypothetical protein EHQ43_10105 [Leptospira bouyouniensis]
MAPKKKIPRKKAPSKRVTKNSRSNSWENTNSTISDNSTENALPSREPEEIFLESRGGKEFEPIPKNKAVVLYREFPDVSPFQESGLILFRAGKYKTHIGPLIGRARDWFGWNYKHCEPFRKYADEIELELISHIRQNSVPVAVGFFRILEEIASGDYDFEDKIQAGKLAFAYLEKTGRLPKSDDKEEEDKKIEQAVQALSTALAEKFGNDLAI